MRNIAHNASAILLNDTHLLKAHSSGMKKANKNTEIITAEIKAQKEEIAAICEKYDVTTSRIAEKIGVAPSTINRFINSEEPKNALSAVTMRKIRSEFPSNERDIKGVEFALLYAIKEILDILLNKKSATQSVLTKDFIYALDRFRDQKILGAASVMDELLAHVKGESHQERQQITRMLLQLAPPR